MEPQNLEAASNYINNVLLARGLLKGGKSIDFAQPDNDEGGADATMAKIINLVNDLVLRRDVCRMVLGGRKSAWMTMDAARSRPPGEPSYDDSDTARERVATGD